MKKLTLKSKIIFITVFALIAAAFIAIALNVNKKDTTVYADFKTAPSFEKTYSLNQVIDVPDAVLVYDGEEYSSTPFITSPNGSVYQKNSVKLDLSGEWSVCYKAQKKNGAVASEEVKFSVEGEIISVGEKSSYKYAEYTNTVYAHKGLQVELANGDTLKYNKIINLNDYSSSDKLFDLFVIPKNVGTADATEIYVTFTDVYDSSNTVTVLFKQTLIDTTTWTYAKAKANEQVYVGLGAASTAAGAVEVDGKTYQYFSGNSIYGNGTLFAFNGNASKKLKSDGSFNKVAGHCYNGEVGDELLAVCWDYDKKQIYNAYGASQKLIADLDNETLMKSAWDGFTTGEVFMSFYAGGYASNSLTMFFPVGNSGTEAYPDAGVYAGINNENFVDDNAYTDVEAPIITVDYGDFDEDDLPKAVASEDCRYKVFSAKAYDKYDGELPVNVNVYYAYATSLRLNVEVKDGSFASKYFGTYTIVYSAKDSWGNYAEKKVEVYARLAEEVLSVINFTSEGIACNAGEIAHVKTYTIDKEKDDGVMQITATSPEGTVYDCSSFEFMPLSSGEYTVTYTYTTYAYTVEKTYKLQIGAANVTSFIGDAVMPKYFIKGAEFALPKFSAYDFSTGKQVETQTKLYVKEDGGERKEISDFSYSVAASASAEIIYSANGTEKTYNVPVVDTGLGGTVDVSKYFYAVSGSPTVGKSDEKGSSGVVYSAESSFSLDFINAVSLNTFNGKFAYGSGVTLKIKFTDVANALNSVEFTFTSGKCLVNGSASVIIAENHKAATDKDSFVGELLSFSFSSVTGVIDVDGTTYTVDKYLNGNAFNGFTADLAYVSVEASAEDGTVTFRAEEINKQRMYLPKNKDNGAPLIAFDRIVGRKSLGDKVIISAASASDVLSSVKTFTLSVSAPDGTAVYNEVAADTAYEITLSQYGSYSVKYTSTDVFGNKTVASYVINVVDKEPPVISFEAKNLTVKVGKKLKVATATVTDNLDESVTVNVFIKAPNGVISAYNEDEGFVAATAGVYTVYYTAYDEAGNMTTASYQITAE